MTQAEVLSRGYAKEIYEYACKNPNADMELLTRALLESKSLPDRYAHISRDEDFDSYDDDYYDYQIFEDYDVRYYYYLFARNIKGANVNLLEKALDDTYDEVVYLFARDVDGANIESLQSKIKYAFPEYIYLFARDVKNADSLVLQDYLLDWLPDAYDMNIGEYVTRFAQDIEGVNIDKMISYIRLFITNPSSQKPSFEYYLSRLEETIKELETIKDNKKRVLTKAKNNKHSR